MTPTLLIERPDVNLKLNRDTASVEIVHEATREIVVEHSGLLVVSGGGGGGAPFVHIQSAPATEWVVNHNLGYRPSVTVFTVGGVEMLAEVVHSTLNQFRVLHNVAVAGTAQGS
jgi:hypothetical protein